MLFDESFCFSEAATGLDLKKDALRNFAVYTMESLFDKVADHEACNFIKKRFQQMCFLVNIAKFLKTAILKNTCERQFLWISETLFKVKLSALFRTTFTLWKTPVGRQLHPMRFRSKGIFLNKDAGFYLISYLVVLPYLFPIIANFFHLFILLYD